MHTIKPYNICFRDLSFLENEIQKQPVSSHPFSSAYLSARRSLHIALEGWVERRKPSQNLSQAAQALASSAGNPFSTLFAFFTYSGSLCCSLDWETWRPRQKEKGFFSFSRWRNPIIPNGQLQKRKPIQETRKENAKKQGCQLSRITRESPRFWDQSPGLKISVPNLPGKCEKSIFLRFNRNFLLNRR